MGAPVGALLFSVEVTASYYLVSNLWKGFLCSIASIVTFAVINTINVGAQHTSMCAAPFLQ
jgi:H+/Cl- antiporter ClcA